MYTLKEHADMIASGVRTKAYIEALRQAVKPGSVVVDVGTGTGVWALLACKFGARKVYAIEPSDIIEVARETAELNGFRDKIEFIHELSNRVTLPELADVMVSDIRGVLPIFSTSLPSIIDARRRFLAPNGTIIPQRDKLWTAIVSNSQIHQTFVGPWETDSCGLNLQNIRKRVTNTCEKERVRPEDLVSGAECWTVIDYRELENHNVSGTVTWNIDKAAAAHGFAVWFDSTLIDSVSFSCAPGLPEVIYGRAFFPWPEAVRLELGDTVSVTLRANLAGSDYVWTWDTNVAGPGGSKFNFRQSTFFGAVLPQNQLHKVAADYVPKLTDDAKVERFILTRIDGSTSVEQISRELCERFPEIFGTFQEALNRVGGVSQRCSR